MKAMTRDNYYSVSIVVATIVTAVSLLLITSQGVSARPEDPKSPLTQGSGSGEPTGSPSYSGLLREAEREGSVRVIVGLRTDFEPEGRLTRSQVANQREAIANGRTKLRADLEGTGYRTVHNFETLPYVALDLSPGALKAAQESPHTSTIHEDRAVAPTLVESTPLIQAPQMWLYGYTGAGQTVAVLDTGVDSSHPFLSGKVVEEACYSSGADCPNGSTIQTGAGSARPCDYSAGCAHGTHVAGIVAGEGSDFSGVAPDADIVAIQVFSRHTGADCAEFDIPSPCTLADESSYMAGLERVYERRNAHEFSSVNMSFGADRYNGNCNVDYSDVKKAIDNLKSVGIATVVAAGNGDESGKGYTDSIAAPACVSSAVSVGATQITRYGEKVAPYSNMASFLDLLAPGSKINSSVPGGGFDEMWGTSMAAPHVAGAWALLEQRSPVASGDEILSALQSTGTMVTDDRVAGGATRPRINIAAASEVINPIANDNIADAQRVEGRLISLKDMNVGATRQDSEPDHLPRDTSSRGEHSVWYRWTAPVTGQVRINTCMSDFDTVLAAYTQGFDGLKQVASDNDSCSASILSNDHGSKVTFDVKSGNTYKIAVSGYSAGSEGTFTYYANYLPPANNNLADAQTVSGSPFSVGGSNVAATRQVNEPDHLPDEGSFGEYSVWYRWIAPYSGDVTLDTCSSNFDTVLAVYAGGDTFDSLNQVASNNDSDSCSGPLIFNPFGSRVSFHASKGEIYRFAVASYAQGEDGWFALHTTDGMPPRVESTNPAHNDTGVSKGANVTATFTEAMDASTINDGTFTLRKQGAATNVAATVTYDAQNERAVLNPSTDLDAGATYIATVTAGAEDVAGNALDQNLNISGFQTKVWQFGVNP